MSHFNSENLDQKNQSEPFDDDDYENDDSFSFRFYSKIINLNYSNLIKYSKIIRETYLFSDVFNRLPQEIQKIQEDFQLSVENIFIFFQLSQQNYSIKGNNKFMYKQCVDLLKMSKYFEVRKLTKEINDYIKKQNDNVDFIILMIQHEIETDKKGDKQEYKINLDIEKMLTRKINECLTNEKFSELPISIIYRIVELGTKNGMENDKLFNFIKKSFQKFYVLFQFVEID